MNKGLLKKIWTLIFILIVLRILLIYGFNYLNVNGSPYVKAENNEIFLNDNLENMYFVKNISVHNGNHKDIYFKSNDRQEFSLLINNLAFLHRVYINNNIVSQNIDEYLSLYDNDYAYKVFQISESDYINNIVKISIEGAKAANSEIYLAKDEILKDKTEIRTALNVIVLVFYFVSTFICLILYYFRRKDNYFLIFTIMGIVSFFKTAVLGELFTFSDFIGITAYNYSFFDNLTSLLNTILPIFIVCSLFDFKIEYKIMSIGFLAFTILGISVIIKGGSFLNFYNILFLITILAVNVIMVVGFIKDKPYSKIIMINGAVYSSSVIYYLMVLKGVLQSGILMFYVNPPYLGASVYMGIFMLAIFLKYLEKVKALEKEKKEFERVMLLRGISHDLKLPLSVIKINNQMMEKYSLSDKEIKDFAKTSLEAAQELENMTDNINSYLSLKQLNVEGQASVKDCFKKLKDHYSSYNKFVDKQINVFCDDEDLSLDINPLHFSRMLYNLIDNALKYNSGQVQITAKYKIDKVLIITIEDNGSGMDKEEADKVFEPFYRIDQSRSVGGLGLGLSVVKGVMDILNGNITIESEKDKGTKIVLSIPV